MNQQHPIRAVLSPAGSAEPQSARMICVVIPFYQRTPGLLRKALDSVMRQQPRRRLQVIVVDDVSLVSAEAELKEWPFADTVTVVARPNNGGPSAARNTGLDAASQFCPDLVAFLDSDDVWEDGHLERAEFCLDQGHDVYVSNWMPLESSSQDAYTLWRKLDPGDHVEIGEQIYSFRGDIVLQEIWRPISKPSTMVYDFRKFPEARFDESLRMSEDKLFFLTLVTQGAKCGFSSKPTVRSGRGVNIYGSAYFGSSQSLMVCIHQARCHRTLQRLPEGRRHSGELQKKRAHIAADFVASYLANLRHTRRTNLGYVATMAREEPWPLLCGLMGIALRHLSKILRPRYAQLLREADTKISDSSTPK